MTVTVSDIVSIRIENDVTINRTSTNFALSNILGTSDRIDSKTRVVEFSNLKEVGEMFCVTDPEYQAAAIYFEQSPEPQSVLISRQVYGTPPFNTAFTNVTLDKWGFASDTLAKLVFKGDNFILGQESITIGSSVFYGYLYDGVPIGTNAANSALIQYTDDGSTRTVATPTAGGQFGFIADMYQNTPSSITLAIAAAYLKSGVFTTGAAVANLTYDSGTSYFSLSGSITYIDAPSANVGTANLRIDPNYPSTNRIWASSLVTSNELEVIGYFSGSTYTALSSTTGATVFPDFPASRNQLIAFNKNGDTLYHCDGESQSYLTIKKRNANDDSAISIDTPIGLSYIYQIREFSYNNRDYLLILNSPDGSAITDSTVYTIDITGDSYSVSRSLEEYDLRIVDINDYDLVRRPNILEFKLDPVTNLFVYYDGGFNSGSGLPLYDILIFDFNVNPSTTGNYTNLATGLNNQSYSFGLYVDNAPFITNSLMFIYRDFEKFNYVPYDPDNPLSTDSNTQIALGGTVNTSAPTIHISFNSETPSQAMNVISNIRNDWYAFTYAVTDRGDPTIQTFNLELAAWAEAQYGTNNSHLFFFNTTDSNVINPSVTTDIFSKNKLANNKHATGVYDPSNKYAAVPAMAQVATIDWRATTIPTLAYKKAINITSNSVLTQSQLDTLLQKFGAAYVQYGILFNGYSRSFKTGSGDYVDAVAAIDVITVLLKGTIAEQIAQSGRLEYSDVGASKIASSINSVLNLFVQNGFLEPGIWNGESFGDLSKGDYVATGYYVYVPPVSTATDSERNSRIYPPFTIALLGSGAIEQVVINGTFQN